MSAPSELLMYGALVISDGKLLELNQIYLDISLDIIDLLWAQQTLLACVKTRRRSDKIICSTILYIAYTINYILFYISK